MGNAVRSVKVLIITYFLPITTGRRGCEKMSYTPVAVKRALDHLGPEYTKKVIDLSVCAYRDLGNGYDIEISCTRWGYRGYVWQLQPVEKIVDRMPEHQQLELLTVWLSDMLDKYGGG